MAKLTRDEKLIMVEEIENCVENLLGSVELDQMEEAGEYIKKHVEDHVDYLIETQKMLLN